MIAPFGAYIEAKPRSRCIAMPSPRNIDAAFLYGCLDLPLVYFRDSQRHPRVLFPPAEQQAAKRFADRRHAHRKAHFAHRTGAVQIARMSDRSASARRICGNTALPPLVSRTPPCLRSNNARPSSFSNRPTRRLIVDVLI
jgi:hypothetical protein